MGGKVSVKYISAVWEDRTITNRCHLLVALALADFANDKGTSWPSTDTVASKARCSIRSAIESMNALERAGKLKVETNAGPHRTNLYTLQILHPANPAPLQTADGNSAVDCTRSVRNRQDPSEKRERENDAAEIYELYPRKVARQKAIKSIVRALTELPKQDLVNAVQHLASMWEGHDLQFLPHPSTWFNEQRYNDEPHTWAPKSPQARNGSVAAPRPAEPPKPMAPAIDRF
jgi:hypothetical protein